MVLNPLRINILPESLPLKKLVGPSFILLGLSLGSGEIILWPYLTAHYGMGIIWGALLGITFQFFMNMEIERYALINGESVFVGLARKIRWLPLWFLLSTFVPWIWPGIIASSAKLIGHVFGIEKTEYLAVAFLITAGAILTLGPILYKTVEGLQKTLIVVGVPTIFVLSVILTKQTHWADLFKGFVGIGNGYLFLPAGIPVASFLAALAYAGAGGNLNLAQSFYIKEKGYGMGKYAGRITSLFAGKGEDVSLAGTTFEPTAENLYHFKKWWRNINIEHLTVFWLTGTITIALLSLLAYVTVFGTSGTEGIGFVLAEAEKISSLTFTALGTFFLIIAGLTLFGTQLTVFDAVGRILAENVVLSFSKYLTEKQIPKTYYCVIWLQIIAGIIILLLGFAEPLHLLTLAAVLNAFAMFVHVGLTLWLNLTTLANQLKPSVPRIAAMIAAFLFYGGFSVYTVITYLT